MKHKVEAATAAKAPPQAGHTPASEPIQWSEEDRSKDRFFVQIAEIAEAMIAKHGKDFTMGTLLLSAKFIAEGKPLIKRAAAANESAGAGKPVGKG